MDQRFIELLKEQQMKTEQNLKLQAQAVASAEASSQAAASKIVTSINKCYELLEKNNAGVAALTIAYGKAWEDFAKAQAEMDTEIAKLNL